MKIIIDKATALKAICKMFGISFADITPMDADKKIIVLFNDDTIEFDFEKQTMSKESLDKIEFKKCPVCAKKSSMASLCNSCIMNKGIIEELKGMLK